MRDIAEAQGVGREFAAFQRLRRGAGLDSPWALADLPTPWRRRVLSIVNDDEQHLKRGLAKLCELIEAAPPRERELLQMALNIDGEYAGDWMQRTEDFAEVADWVSTGRTVRRRVDLAIIQLLRRTLEGAEETPAPPEAAPTRTSAPGALAVASFFTEDYVRNSPEFVAAWKEAKTLDMCGFGHNRMFVSYSSELTDMLTGGGGLRVLLQDPEGQAVLDANRRSSTPKASEGAVRHQHRAGLATLRAILNAANSPTDSVVVRSYDLLPPFTAYFFNVGQENAVAYIWFWSWRQASSWRPGFRVEQTTDPLWFDRFHSQFEALWHDEETTREVRLVGP